MIEERLQIAVFVDFDNISIGIKNSLSRNFEIGVVLEAIKERGEVITKIAYGDWKRAEDFSRAMTQYAVQMVQRNVTPRGDKNGADINLALDALEMAFTRNHINAFVIVGGDSDFIALVEKLKQYGKKVFVVGGRAFTSTILQKNCHEFIAYENLIGAQPATRKTIGRGPVAAATTTPLETALPQVRRALKVLSDREVSPQLGLLKSTLLQLDPTFSERDFGTGTFLEFIQKMANAGFVQLKQVDRSWLVELKEPEFEEQEHQISAPPPPPERPQAHTAAAHHHRSLSYRHEPAAFSHEDAPGPDASLPQETAPAEERAPEQPAGSNGSESVSRNADAIGSLRALFANARTAHHWPMYLRSFKQVLRSSDSTFDERNYGFTSVYDLVRQAQREGLLRVERNRKGILRIFPGEHFPQPGQSQRPAEEFVHPPDTFTEAEPSPSTTLEAEPAEITTDVPAGISGEIFVEPELIQESMPQLEPQSEPQPAPEPEHPAGQRKTRVSRGRRPAQAKQPKTRKTSPRKTKSRKTTEGV
jgi:uncharacterized protein (TIGR00288 family)